MESPQYTPIEQIPKIMIQGREHFASGATLPIPARREALRTLARLLLENKTAIAEAIHADKNSPNIEAYLEIVPALKEIDLAVRMLDQWTTPKPAPFDPMFAVDRREVSREPRGHVLIIGPWNYPVLLVLQPLVSALAAGCTVVIKPSEVAKNTAKLTGELIAKYFQPGLVTVVQGGVTETQALLRERFDMIFYTGNSVVGSLIMEAAAKHLTPVVLELGGKCPVIVLPDADIENTASRITWGRYLNCGQTCVAPDYILCHPSVRPALVAALRKRIIEFYGEHPHASKDLARVINPRHRDRLRAVLEAQLATNKDTGVVVGGLEKLKDAEAAGAAEGEGWAYFPPTVLENVGLDPVKNPIMKDEIFGPILPVIDATPEEAIRYINSKDDPLAMYVFSKDTDKVVKDILPRTKSGAVTVNGTVIQVAMTDMPFGGVGKSGMGNYHAEYGFHAFTYERTRVIRPMGWEILHKLTYPPNTDKVAAKMQMLFSAPPSDASLRFRSIIDFLFFGKRDANGVSSRGWTLAAVLAVAWVASSVLGKRA
ncbi:aldehyde dehydrogenase 3, member A2 [Phlyctochytrium bullatum]|nr:aldehyde dehydrogenase 3, member A2 [Phlyctochytrium bullatum]